MIFLRINLPNFNYLGGGLEPSGLWEFTPMYTTGFLMEGQLVAARWFSDASNIISFVIIVTRSRFVSYERKSVNQLQPSSLQQTTTAFHNSLATYFFLKDNKKLSRC